MIRRWLAARSEQELRNILAEPILKPGALVWPDNTHCLVGAAAHVTILDSESFTRAFTIGLMQRHLFDQLCSWGTERWKNGHVANIRITRLIHEACLRELVRRGPTVPTLVPALEETSV